MSAKMAIDANAIDGLVRLPEVLLTDDEDVLWLRDGDELQVPPPLTRRAASGPVALVAGV